MNTENRNPLSSDTASPESTLNEQDACPKFDDPVAGWKAQSVPATEDTAEQVEPGANYTWGWATGGSVRVDSASPNRRPFPELLVAETIGTPGSGGAGKVVHSMPAAPNTGHILRVAHADKKYFPTEASSVIVPVRDTRRPDAWRRAITDSTTIPSASNLKEEGIAMNADRRTLLPTATVAHANALITQTGILDRIAGWKQQSVAGRPSAVSERAILVGLMLLAREQSPLTVTNLAHLFHRRLTAGSHRLLGLGQPDDTGTARVNRQWQDRTRRAFVGLVALMDPYPKSASARSFTQVSDLLDADDLGTVAKMRARLREFNEAFLLMTVAQQPKWMREAYSNIDLAIDEVFAPCPIGNGFSRKQLASQVAEETASGGASRAFRPVDVSADWYALDGNDDSDKMGSLPGRPNFGWGWAASIAVRVDPGTADGKRVPPLVVAATLRRPREGVAEDAIHLMSSALRTGLTPGTVCADMRYFANQRIEKLHVPTAELGFTPVTDYRTDRLGVHTFKNGAVFIEGKAYCPELPHALQNASIDYRQGRIDGATYRLRLQDRKHYELRRKSGPDKNGRYRLAHPLNFFYGHDHASQLDRVCVQKSVTFDSTDGLSHRQAFDYMSDAWLAAHRRATSTLESFNANFRSLQEHSRRRATGFAAAQLFTTIELAAYNLDLIVRFVREDADE